MLPLSQDLSAETEILSAPSQALHSIGPYRLIRKIGEGGMGQVWLAEQTAPLRRQVALKLIRAGRYDDSLLRRFESERQSLALMNHPAIAKVFEAGSTSDGQPFFVMEYVPGEPIMEFCDRKKLKIRERLDLFVKACEGVQHAHQKAIIHRDIKPANILVVEIDGKPVPRLIDFGLAKSVVPMMGQEMFTQASGFIGTPGYMSPEQMDPNVQDIDTRTDVYSLGVVLYELLTGLLPFDAKQWCEQPLYEMVRRIREQDPPSPSTRVATAKASSASTAESRGIEPKQLAHLLHGDLDWVTMKALEKDRSRRYGTPSELAADIGRYLNHEPVLARPASSGYRLQKYIRRHRVAVGVSAGLVILLAGFAGVQTVQLRRITRERDRANRIAAFTMDMFRVSDPSEARGNTIKAREILDKASSDIDTGLAKDPETQAQMMNVMGKVYDNLGLYPPAESLLQRAIKIRESILGPENLDTLRSKLALAWTYVHEGRYSDAEKLQSEVLQTDRRILGPDNPDTLTAAGNLAATLNFEGHYAQAENLQRQVLDARRRILGPDNLDTSVSMDNLATVLQMEGRYADAEKLDRDAIEVRARVLGADHPDTLGTMGNLANVLNEERQYAEAEKLNRQLLDARRRIFGPENPVTLRSMNNLANVLHREGQDVEAEKLFRETIAIQQRVLGPEHPETIMSMNNLSAVLSKQGKYVEAEKLGREVLDIRRKVLGPEHPLTLRAMSNLADSESKLGRWNEAESLLQQAQSIDRRVLGPDSPETAFSTYNLACVAAHQGKRTQALSMLRDAVDHGLPAWIALEMGKDPDLASLHGDSRFDALVLYAKERNPVPAKHN
ncbi:MAG: serine/threonine-protein kinase [Candidatus Acidiferrum sp.]